MGHIEVEVFLDRLPDVHRQLEIRLAEIALDHPGTTILHFLDVRSDLEGVFGAEDGGTRGKQAHGGSPLARGGATEPLRRPPGEAGQVATLSRK